jgi:ATP-dependent DNA ligase
VEGAEFCLNRKDASTVSRDGATFMITTASTWKLNPLPEIKPCEVSENVRSFFQSTKPPWYATIKYDGHRKLLTFPDETVLDAELVANEGKQNDLYLLGRRTGVYKVFDIPRLEGKDLRGQTLNERWAFLEKKLLALANPQLQLAETLTVADSVAAVIAARDIAIARGFEGVVVKPPLSVYSDNIWLKMKKTSTADMVLLGIVKTESWLKTGTPHSFLIGYWDPEEGVFKRFGKVGTAKNKFDWNKIAEDALRIPVSEDDDCIHVTPKIVIEAEYTQALSGSFREPRIVRIRRDKTPQDCTRTWK